MVEALTIKTTPRDDHQLDLAIELGPERTEAALQQAARLAAKRARIPGFRPGRAPYGTVLRMFGRDGLLNEIVDDLGQEVYQEALAAEHIDAYGQAAMTEFTTTPLAFKLVVPLRPTVELGDYESIRVEAPQVSVSEADVENVLEQQRNARAAWDVVDRPAEIGDTVVTDITGSVGDESIMDNHDWDLILKSDSGWLPGFDDAFVGLKAADEKSFVLTYPEDSASRFKGQQATFRATVKAVKARVPPALDDEFARSLGDYADLADLRAKVLANMTEQRTAEAENMFESAAVDALVEKATIAYPPVALEESIHELLDDLERRVSQIGYKLEDYLRLQGTTREEYHTKLEPQAASRLKGRLALRELAEREHLTATPAEIESEIEAIVAPIADEARAATLRKTFSSEGGQALLSRDILTRKSLARLREIAAPKVAEEAAGASAEPEPAVSAPVTEEPEAGTQAVDAATTATEPAVETPAA